MLNGSPHHAPSSRTRVAALLALSTLVMTLGAVLLLPIGIITLCRARRLYSRVAGILGHTILHLWGIRLVVHREGAWPAGQVVYVSNHPCTLDPFILVALRLPNTRFFLSGFLQKIVPLGIIARLMGTFFTVSQDRPTERVRIFQRADRILRHTGESVYLSPEGQRVTTGEIGAFNKGAFHLATSLGAPIVPLYFFVPREVDPGSGYDARPGTVHVWVYPPINTHDWRLEDVVANKERVRELYLAWHRERRSSG